MTYDFQVVSCHGDHAGKAHVSISHGGGPCELVVRNMAFAADPAESVAEEQARILAEAARLAREAADFLAAEAVKSAGWPTGPGRREGQAPNAFGYPLSKA